MFIHRKHQFTTRPTALWVHYRPLGPSLRCVWRKTNSSDRLPVLRIAFRSLGCAAIDLPAGELSGSQLPTLPASVSVRRFLLVRRRNTMLVYGSTLPSVGETLDPQRPHLFTLTWFYTIATVPNCLMPAHCAQPTLFHSFLL